MKNVKATLLTVILMCLPFAALADFRNGNSLLEDCQAPAGAPGSIVCAGYVFAIADVQLYGDIGGVRSCVPANVTGKQVIDVVTRYLQQHPEQRHYGAASLVAHALSENFPCN
jgi:hypothetical protein